MPRLHKMGDAVTDKLFRNYKEHGTLIVAFDYDDTIYPYSDDYTQRQYEKRWEILRECKDLDFYLILYTCNGQDRYEEMMEFMDKNNIPYDAINQNHPDFGYEVGRKIFYNILLDDKAGLDEALKNLCHVINVINLTNNPKIITL